MIYKKIMKFMLTKPISGVSVNQIVSLLLARRERRKF